MSEVFVVVVWPGNPEDRPPRVVGASCELAGAQRIAAEDAWQRFEVGLPTEWREVEMGATRTMAEEAYQATSKTSNHVLKVWEGAVAPEIHSDAGDYEEERRYEIHQLRVAP